MNFRDYQINASMQTIALLDAGENRILIHSPTGSGKTVIAGKIIMDLPENYQNILFIVNREALLFQGYGTFTNIGIKSFITHNKIVFDRKGVRINKNPDGCKVLITLIGSANNISQNFKPDLIILDEAHKSTSAEFQKLVEMYNVPVIGLTATPHRAKDKEGESLYEWYGDNLITTISYRQLVDLEHLSELEYHSLSNDCHVVDTWVSKTSGYENKRTILFTENTKHSLEMREAFLNRGIVVEIITSGDEEGLVANQQPNERNRIFNLFSEGRIDILISVMALCEGFDEPMAKFCFICRRISDENISLFHQICGRVARPHESKNMKGVVVDFGGNYDRFGSLEDYEYLDLSYTNSVKMLSVGERIHRTFTLNRKLMLCCNFCQHVYNVSKGIRCSHCGEKNTVKLYCSVADLRDELMKVVTPDTLRKFGGNNKTKTTNEVNEIKVFFHITEVMKRAIASKKEAMFNSMYFRAFDDDGKCNFPWLNSIKPNMKMDQNLEWELS